METTANYELLKNFKGKTVFVKLTDGSYYNGVILDVECDNQLVFVKMRDKFGKLVLFTRSEILKIEEREGKEWK